MNLKTYLQTFLPKSQWLHPDYERNFIDLRQRRHTKNNYCVALLGGTIFKNI